ncbi:unnamed protein product [Mytilus edulis]|uniref:C2H2-type domain-containing protein n=1 Tax=Mytilus edulis TaxID=6550 RepID=A0A8S3QQ75_MYTED|nr:unnamed protein product [Mytilus edulis]
MCKIYKIDKTRTTSFHPQGGGVNRNLEDMLSKVISRDQKDWDECLPLTMLAYRSSVHESTKHTPNLMMHGREAQLPIDLLYGPSPDEAERVEPHGYVDRVQQSLWKIHQKARDKIAVASTRQKTQYDLHIFKNKYTVGTPVWLNIKIRKKGLSPKLQDRWEGPYLIIGMNMLRAKVPFTVYQCPKCPVGFPTAARLLTHEEQVHEPQDVCPFAGCDVSFPRQKPDRMHRHIQRVHPVLRRGSPAGQSPVSAGRRRRPRPSECPVMESEIGEALPNIDYWAVPVPDETLTEQEGADNRWVAGERFRLGRARCRVDGDAGIARQVFIRCCIISGWIERCVRRVYFKCSRFPCRPDSDFPRSPTRETEEDFVPAQIIPAARPVERTTYDFEMQDLRLFFAGAPSSYVNSCPALRDIRNMARISSNRTRRFVPVGFACMQKLERATLPDGNVYELTDPNYKEIHTTDTQTCSIGVGCRPSLSFD